jgi:hypothetical protein
MAGPSLPTTLLERLRTRLAGLGPNFEVASAAKEGDATTYQLTGEHLVAVDETDEDHPLSVAIPVPVTVRATKDAILDATAAQPSADDERQAQLFARDLIARGAVKGLSGARANLGPPARATHVIDLLPDGRRVIRRLGFDVR